MQAMPYSLLATSALDAAQATLTTAVAAWAGQWGLAAEACGVAVARAWDSAPLKGGSSAWSACSGQGEGAAWLAAPAEMLGPIERALFAPDGNYAPHGEAQASLAPAAARRAFDALQDALLQAVLPGASRAPGEPPAALSRRGSGAVLVTLAMGKQVCQLLLNGAALRALQGKAAPLGLAPLAAVDYRQAVAATPVVLQLTVGAAQVSLGSLLSLAPGDVVRLDAGADGPVSMATLSGVPVFEAYLGKVGDQIAVEAIIRHSTSFGAVK